ncbi:MAG TPA: ATP-dependent DNA ligase, partial [Candidatus Nanoarchaeia archaeon]|nr:ATP-dependent DNA ligase [Candidatus Nanoarchaeia archaeon]
GKGAVGRKVEIVCGLLQRASSREALYISRTLMSDLRIGVADSIVLDAIALAFFEGNKEIRDKLEEKYNVVNDFLLIIDAVSDGSMKSLEKLSLKPGVPFHAMLSTKVADVEEGFEECGKPAAFEYKYDGFRMLIHKDKGKIWLFTRKMENVTAQFPDVVLAVKENVNGDTFILDAEAVGYDSKTKKYMPFEHISQRIRRKYDISELQEKLPVEVNVFDVLYLNGESVMEKPFSERRKIVEKVVSEKKLVIRPAQQLITDNADEANDFYGEALKAGEEGVMIKNLNVGYKQGRYVGHLVKLKPVMEDLDLVIVGAEHGTGKRGNWYSSFIVACKDGDNFVEVGRVSSGLKEKEEEGFTYQEMTKLIEDIIIEEDNGIVKVEPKIVVSVTYQNVQKSPGYSSGFALRFPRITAYRPDKNAEEVADISEIEKSFKKGLR